MAICATVALVLLAKMGGGAMGAGLWVGLTVAVMILGAQVPLLSSIRQPSMAMPPWPPMA